MLQIPLDQAVSRCLAAIAVMLNPLFTRYLFMHVGSGAMAIVIAFAGTAAAQSTVVGPASRCSSEATAISSDMDVARSKGQMLRHRQLSDQRAALLKNCSLTAGSESPGARIKHLELRIVQLKGELTDAEAELERLRKAQ